MTRLPQCFVPPVALLARVRCAFLLIALFDAGLSLALIGASHADAPMRIAGAAAAVFLGVSWVRGYRQGGFRAWSDVLAGPALLLVGFGLGDPLRSATLVYPGLFLRALFGGRRSLIVATMVQLGAFAVAVVCAPMRDQLTVWSPDVLLQPSGVFMVGVMYALGSSLARHERSAVRERALARVGSELVASADEQAVFAAMLECVRAIVAPHAPPQAVLVAGNADRMHLVNTTRPDHADRLRGVELDLMRLPGARQLLLRREPIEVTGDQIGEPAVFLGLRTWTPVAYAIPLFARERLCGALAVMSDVSLPEECKDGLQALGMEVALALDNIALRLRLEHEAFYDSLTGLANRSLLTDRTQHALSRAGRGERGVAVLLLDVDAFKTVNDSLGHAAGDRVLSEVAARLRGCLREGDTAARLGGDEFAVMLEERDASLLPTAEMVAQRILDALRSAIALSSTEVFVSASIGIAVGRGAEHVDELLSQADVAMYAAKRSGKSRFSVFEPSLRSDVVNRLELETDLRRALEADQFVLHYQPIVRLGTREPVAFEALVRWQHPRLGLVPPDRFIPLAEETGLIVPLGRWVLDQACQQAQRWQDVFPKVSMHVNVAARQLREPGFVADVRAALSQAGAHPSRLVLEVTENALIHRSEGVVNCLHELRAMGVHLALDDFGTGYSSLAYLRDLPFDSVKVDKAFVSGVVGNAEREALVRAIVGLSEALRLEAIPEGVETTDEAAGLERLGCKLAQGYYFARPADAASIERLLLNDMDAQPLVA